VLELIAARRHKKLASGATRGAVRQPSREDQPLYESGEYAGECRH
jgi:hypothetical protein